MYSFFQYDFCDIYLEATKVHSPTRRNCFCVFLCALRGCSWWPRMRRPRHPPSPQPAHACGCASTSIPPFASTVHYHFSF